VSRGLLAIVVVSLAAAAAVVVIYSRRPPRPPAPGIPLALADDRAERISNLSYEVALEIPAERTAAIEGTIAATFSLSEASRPVSFDFAQPADRLRKVTANGADVVTGIVDQHVTIPAASLVAGENTIAIEFIAGDESLNRRDDMLYALFVPARASLAMPVFDQPNLKARWQLRLTLPEGWTAVSNGRQAGTLNAPGKTGLIFDRTEPIPTYLFSFAAGRFQVETAVRGGREMRMFHRETDAAKVARNREAIFDLHAAALAWLEDYTAIPYAFGKFDFVAIPSFQFGGMEHPGAVFYNASSLFLEPTATKNQFLGRASLIAHETAHMWFGDLVTMRWFNDVWMKEVFANFMAAKIVNPSFPDVNHELRFLLSHYPAAYGVDRTEGANPIRQDLANLNEAGSLYGAIIYQKAPIVMRQLELLMGPDAMRDGLREYLRGHAMGNASWPDLVRALDARTDVDLEAWSRAWVEERGRPRVIVRLETGADGPVVSFTTEDPLGRGLMWPQRLRLAVGYGDRTGTLEVDLREPATRVPLSDARGAAPAWMLPTGGGLAYGDFVLDAPQLEALAAALPSIADPVDRGAAAILLWESMLEARVAPRRLLDAVMGALPREADELNVQALLGDLRGLFWRFTEADAREALAPEVERLLRAGLDRAPDASRKAAWFNALRSVATTPATLEWLAGVWRRDTKVPGLPLAESDEINLAQELAVRDVPGAAELLQAQLARIENPDRRERFAFVMPALSGDEVSRDAFFESLKDVRNRQREAWVLEAAGYLHHPLRAGSSRRYVTPALELVREIQRTGDIFFPKRWADATLGGYQTVQTAAEVREFIAALPGDYPPRLRWVLLSAADDLFRAARILHQ
jgi:aminopeptidase N